ncbi:hypothetical protein Chor_005809, partial [Crotalus horridus]
KGLKSTNSARARILSWVSASGGGIDQDPAQNPFSEDKTDKGIYVTRVTEGGPAEMAGLQVGDKIMQVKFCSV